MNVLYGYFTILFFEMVNCLHNPHWLAESIHFLSRNVDEYGMIERNNSSQLLANMGRGIEYGM